ncbi:MAG: tRNA epoxyqueuosine(34) reductase QueG, partial [Pedosphaera parvula]|nr:tRNA epoxyqueuosine(34) reductase QueG [Pedosphaera parvula]
MKEAIRQRARELGFDACQFTLATPPDSAGEFQSWLAAGRHGEMGYLERNAHKRIDPQQVLPGARSVICLAASYFSGEKESGIRSRGAGASPEAGSPVRTLDAGPQAAGVVARYARYADYHDVLGERLKMLTDFIDQMAGGGMRSLWYVDTGPLLERDLAQRAGVGFIGKHTNLISRQLGNWFFLAEIITVLEFDPDLPERNHCGHCIRCLAACPTGAITAPFQLDARRCISYLTIELKDSIPVALRPAIGNRIYGCDDCLAVCPWNKFAREGGLLKQYARPDLQTPELIELLSLDDAAFKRRFSGSPLLRSKRRGLLRNVCVALGNVGGASALPALQRAAAGAEPLIAEHAC